MCASHAINWSIVWQGESMRISRAVVAAGLMSAMAVGFAAPAWSDDFSGMYNVVRSGIRTSDGPACGNPVPMTGGPEIFVMDKA
jgi:hypothetical protein